MGIILGSILENNNSISGEGGREGAVVGKSWGFGCGQLLGNGVIGCYGHSVVQFMKVLQTK